MTTDGDRRHDARGVCDPAPMPAIPVSRTALWTGGAAIAVGLLATAALLPVGPLSVRAGLLALGCVLVGIAAQLGSAVMLPPRNGASWAMLALFAHGVRLGVSLACGLWVTLLSRPDRVGFWSVFLAASLAAITAEAALIVRASQRLWRGPRGGDAPRGVHQP